MEEGLWEEANTEKLRLEEKQRAVRRARESEAEKATDQGELENKIEFCNIKNIKEINYFFDYF